LFKQTDELQPPLLCTSISFQKGIINTKASSLSKGKAKYVPLHDMEALWVRREQFLSFTTSALDGGEWSASRPGRAIPPVPIVQEAGWASEPVWTQRLQEKSFRLSQGSNHVRPVVESVVRHYTDSPSKVKQGKV
jgi:hypothetical protein